MIVTFTDQIRMFHKLFPKLRGQNVGYINLAEQAVLWREKFFDTSIENPLLVPSICEEMIEHFHRQLGLVASYGGWQEKRAKFWQGSYLDAISDAIHLGVDFNVKSKSIIAAPQEFEVLQAFPDDKEDFGWGPRLFLKPTKPNLQEIVFVFAHLADTHIYKPGSIIKANKEFTMVGQAPHNGNWYAHLHVQAIRHDDYRRFEQQNFSTLDGYGPGKEIYALGRTFPDPLPYLFI